MKNNIFHKIFKLSFIIIFLMAPRLWATNSVNLENQFQREYTYWISQKSALLQQLQKNESQQSSKNKQLKNEIKSLQKKLVSLSSVNDQSQALYEKEERLRKERERRAENFQSHLERSMKNLNEFRSRLDLKENSAPLTIEMKDPQTQFLGLVEVAEGLLRSSAAPQKFLGGFTDFNGDFRAGEITRYGPSAAVAESLGELFVLGPDGLGGLKSLEVLSSTKGPWANLFLFESMGRAAQVKLHKGWIENVADQAPLLFLGLILLLVGWLFVAILKV